LTATNTAGSNSFTQTNYITVSPAVVTPVAGFTGTPTSGTAPLTVTFTDSSINTPTSWSWNFGDGSTSTIQNPSHTYMGAGTYTVSLTATNTAGSHTITRTNYITVINVNQNPVAEAGTPQTLIAKEPATFDGSQSKDPDGSIASYAWNFGDGSSGSGISQIHSFGASGTFTVTLTVTDNEGAKGTDTTTVTVKSPSQATQDVITQITSMNLPKEIESSLTSKLDNVVKSLDKGNVNAAKNQLEATINEITAQKGKKIPGDQATTIIAMLQKSILYL